MYLVQAGIIRWSVVMKH